MGNCRVTIALYITTIISSASTKPPLELPRDVAGQVGDRVTVTCVVGVGDGVVWREIINSKDPTIIYREADGVKYPDKHEIDGTYNLVIKKATRSDGGRYSCLQTSTTEAYGANVLVFEPITPKLSDGVLVENTPTNVSCRTFFITTANLDDDAKPLFKFVINGVELNGVTKTVTEDTSYGTNQQWNYTLEGYATYTPKYADIGSNLDCIVVNKSGTEHPVSGRIPIEFQYKPREVNLPQNFSKYEVGDKIQISGNGIPTPNYIWTSVKSPAGIGVTITVDEYFTIEERMVDRDNESESLNIWTCVATNIHGSSDPETLTFYVDPEPRETTTDKGTTTDEPDIANDTVKGGSSVTNDGPNVGAIVGGLVGALVGVGVCAGAVVAAKKHKEKKEKKKADEENNSGVVNGGATGKDHEDDAVSPYAINDLPQRGPEANAYRPQSTQYADPDAVVPGRKQPPKFGNSNDYALAGDPNKQEPDPNIVYGKVNKQPVSGDRDSTLIVDNATYTPYEPQKSPPKTRKPNKLPPIASTTNDSRPPVSQKPKVSGRSINV